MKILYLLSHNPFVEDGITKKIISQTTTWREFGHTVKIFNVFIKDDIPQSKNYINAKIYKRENIFKSPVNLYDDIFEFDPDIIYFRFEPWKPFLYKIIKKYKTVIELNTLDIEEQQSIANLNLYNRIRYIYIRYTYKWLFKHIDGIIGVSKDVIKSKYLSAFNVPQVVIPNSINLASYKTLKSVQKNNKIPNLFFMGSKKYLWHGVDKILELASKTQNELFFHLVGVDNDEQDEYPNIRFYGFQPKEVYINILKQCHICIGTLGMHRISIDFGSTLKTLEYLAYGFPIIVGYYDHSFLDIKNPDFVLMLPNNEDNITQNVDRIIDFCYSKRDVIVNHSQVRQHIDSHIVEKKRLDFFKEIMIG